MKLNRKWILVASLLLSVALATSGTLAYLSDADKDVNTMTIGSVEIVQNEQERVNDGDKQHNLVAFTQDKPLFPAVYPGNSVNQSIQWAASDEWPVADNEAWKVVEDNENVVDKFVTVTNTGKSDAYVRTIIAYEGAAINGTDIHIIHNAVSSSNEDVAAAFAATEYIENIVIDGTRYDVIVYTYAKPLAPGETTIPSLKQIYMDHTCGNKEMETYGEKYDILVLSQAVQSAGFAKTSTKSAAQVALEDGFGAVTQENLKKWLDETLVGSPGDKNGTNNPPVPFANVNILDADTTLTLDKGDDGEVTILGQNRTIDTTGSKMGLDLGEPISLDVAYQFEPSLSLDEVEESDYRYWHADFVVSADKNIPAYSVGLAGYYDAWCSLNEDKWVMLASPDAIAANTEIRLVESMGGGSISVNYEELCQYGNDGIGFLCGAVDLGGKTIDGSTVANVPAGTTLTVELRLYETEEPSAENGNSRNEETGNYITTGVYTFTF